MSLPLEKMNRLPHILAASVLVWLGAGASASALTMNTNLDYSTATTNLVDDYGWNDAPLLHQISANNSARVSLGNGSANTGRVFIGLYDNATYFGNGNLMLTATSGVPGTIILNGYNTADPVIGRLGHVSNGDWTGTLTITGGVSVVVGNHRLKYEGGNNTVTVASGSLDYSTPGFGFYRSNSGNNPGIKHLIGANGSIILDGLITNAAQFSNWAMTNNGASVGASDVTVTAGSGLGLVFTPNSPVTGKTTITTMTVLQPPTILTVPPAASYLAGDYLVPLNVTVNGSMPFFYQWQQNGVALPGATNASYSLATPLTPNNAGAYTVVVTNVAGRATSAPPAMISVANATNVADQAAAIVGHYQSLFSHPPSQIPNNGAVDAPLLGNGSTLAALGGSPGLLQFYLNRNDLWIMQTNGSGGPLPLSRLDVTLSGMAGASYGVQQDFLHGMTTGQFVTNGITLNLETAVSATSNLLWVLLSTTSGSVTGQASLFISGGASITTDNNDLQLGREQYGSGRWYMDGLLDEVRVYTRTLSATEIAMLSATQNVSGNLIRWWSFDNVTNSAVPDLSGSGANGTLMGGWSLTNGVTGSALNLNGTNAYLDTPVCQAQSALTVSAFINVRTLPPAGSAQYIFSNGEWNDGWSLGLSQGMLRMAVGASYAQATTVIPTNQWLNVAGTFDGTVIRAYVNGLLVAVGGDTNSSSGISGTTQWVERDSLTGVAVPDAAASALSVVGSTNGTFIVTSNQPVLLVVSSQSLMVTNNFLTNAINSVSGFQMADLAPLQAAHQAWWSNFWGRSFVEIPDQTLMQRYYLSQYVLASASRGTNFPPGLQGWVTTDNPDWNGDYHLNYNFEAPFYGLYAANHIEQADPYNQPIFDIANAGRQFSQSQLGIPGIYLPVGIGPKGSITGLVFLGQKSDASYACVPLAQRWYMTRDLCFATNAYPFVRDVAGFWTNYLVLQNGSYVDPNDAIQEGTDDTNPILSLGFIRQTLNLALDMSTALGVDASSRPNWQNILTNLSPYPTGTVASVLLANGYGWPAQLPQTMTSSNLPIFRYSAAGTAWWANNTLGIQHIYPGCGIGFDSPPDLLLRATNQVYVMNRWMDNNGMSSFYTAAAHAGYDPGTIMDQMTNMVDHWGWANGFYSANGGWMENESVVPNAIQEMLLQSYEGVIRFFPCWPAGLDARFGNLRAYGAFLVSAQQHNGGVAGVSITSEQGWPCTIQNPWPGLPVAVTRNGLLGEVVSGTRFTLTNVPNDTLALAPATGYDLWAQQITNAALRNPAADASGDGNANLLEYVTGGNPAVATGQPLLSASATNGLFSLNFTRNTNSTDAMIVVQRALSLGSNASWTGIATNQNGNWIGTVTVSETGAGTPRQVTVQDLLASPGENFYRLQITLP